MSNPIPQIGTVTTEAVVRQIHEAASAATWPANQVDLGVVETALRQSLGAVQQEMSWRQDKEVASA